MNESAPRSLERKAGKSCNVLVLLFLLSHFGSTDTDVCLPVKGGVVPAPQQKATVSPFCDSENVNRSSRFPESISSITLASWESQEGDPFKWRIVISFLCHSDPPVLGAEGPFWGGTPLNSTTSAYHCRGEPCPLPCSPKREATLG